jgi:hypothetical protein
VAEPPGDVVCGQDTQVAADVGVEQPPEREEADDIDRAGRRAQDSRQYLSR